MAADALLNQLSLTNNGVAYEWHLGNSATYTEAEYKRHHTWDVLKLKSPTPRHALYRELCSLIRSLSISTRQQLICEIVVWSGVTYTSETVKIARSLGLSCTCSNFEGVVWKGVDRFQLLRFLMRDWSGEELAHCLQEWFDG